MAYEDAIHPPHWPQLAGGERERDERAAIKALAAVRRMIVDYRRRVDNDWRAHHARTAPIADVVAGLIADTKVIEQLFLGHDKRERKLHERVRKLEDDLAESKRPFTAQMDMQNRRIIDLNNQILRLQMRLDQGKLL